MKKEMEGGLVEGEASLVSVASEPLLLGPVDGLTAHAIDLKTLLSLTWQTNDEQSAIAELVARCQEHISAGRPCEHTFVLDQALVTFLSYHWQPEWDALLGALFSSYVEHGYIKPNEPVRCASEGVNNVFNGRLPVVAATHRGAVRTALFLIEHGASTDVRIDGQDFFEWSRQHAGRDIHARDDAWCAAAASVLLETSMRVRIGRSADLASGPRRRFKAV